MRSQIWNRITQVASFVASRCPLLGACHRAYLSLTSGSQRTSASGSATPGAGGSGAPLVTLTSDSFAQLIEGTKGVALVDFWAPWCMPCRLVGPTIERLSGEYAGRATVGKLNVDEHVSVASRYHISSIPTVGVFRDGQLVSQLVGVRTEQVYREAVESALASGVRSASGAAASSRHAAQ